MFFFQDLKELCFNKLLCSLNVLEDNVICFFIVRFLFLWRKENFYFHVTLVELHKKLVHLETSSFTDLSRLVYQRMTACIIISNDVKVKIEWEMEKFSVLSFANRQ